MRTPAVPFLLFATVTSGSVPPFVQRFGVRGIAYILAHPLDLSDGDAFRAAVQYQRTALESLQRG